MYSKAELKRMGLRTLRIDLFFKPDEIEILKNFALQNGYVRERFLNALDVEGKARWTYKDNLDAARDAINWMVRHELTKAKALENINGQ